MFYIKIELRRRPVLDNLFAINSHFEFRDPSPLQPADSLRRLRHRILRRLGKALFGYRHNVNYFLHHRNPPLIHIGGGILLLGFRQNSGTPFFAVPAKGGDYDLRATLVTANSPLHRQPAVRVSAESSGVCPPRNLFRIPKT